MTRRELIAALFSLAPGVALALYEASPDVPKVSTTELEDFAEGTWTPSEGAPFSGVSQGMYVKVGDIVYLTGVIHLNRSELETILPK